MTNGCMLKVDPATIAVTHIFDGEEVVSAFEGEQQVWLATFACPKDAEFFVECVKNRANGSLMTLQFDIPADMR